MAKTDEGFFERAGLDRANVQSLVDESLRDSDDGELFLEYRQSESFVFDDGRELRSIFTRRRSSRNHRCSKRVSEVNKRISRDAAQQS